MALVGGLVFCTACGNLLDRKQPEEKSISCKDCGTSNQNRWPLIITTRTKPGAFPSPLQQKRDSKVQRLTDQEMQDVQGWQLTQETCPECQNPEMRFMTAQTRGADEGSTVFYECPNCSHRFNTNN